MRLAGTEIPVVLVVLAALALAALVAVLVDLSRQPVQHLPKWAWALVVVGVSFPLGAILYLVLGRAPRDHEPAQGPCTPVASAPVLRPPGPTSRPVARSGEAAIVTTSLSKVYGDRAALRDVDLLVPWGATYGLIGPNGAGKTTMLAILAGLRRPTSGTVDLAVPRQRIGVLVDTPQFEPWLTAWEVVDLARHLTAPHLPRDRVEQALIDVGLADAARRRAGGFSRGMLQRLGLATCLVGDPEILLLDEPSSALDPAGRREVLDLIGRLAHSKTVVLSTHILSDVQQVADVVGVIDGGELRYQGLLTDMLARTSTAFALHVRPPADALAAQLKAQPWVEDVEEHAPGRLRVVVTDAALAEREIPALLAGREIALVSFNPATDLETAFLELTA